MPSWRPWFAVLVLCPGIALGAKLRLCTDVQPHLPYLTPEGGGTIGELVAAAARESGVEVEYQPASLARCRAEVALNLVHGFPMTPFLPEALPFAAYPMRGGAPDPARAVIHARIMLYRRIGAAATWNGKRIDGLARPVLVAAGSVAIQSTLNKAGVPMDDNAKSLDINFAKMLAGRGELAAGFEEEGRQLLRLPRYAGRIEMLRQPLLERSYYLAISRDYYKRNGPAVERMWNAIGRLNQSAKALEK